MVGSNEAACSSDVFMRLAFVYVFLCVCEPEGCKLSGLAYFFKFNPLIYAMRRSYMSHFDELEHGFWHICGWLRCNGIPRVRAYLCE